MTRQCLRAMLEDENHVLPLCDEVLNLPLDTQNNITWMGFQLQRSDAAVQKLKQTKELFINELLANLDRRFPEDGNLN